MDTWYLEVRVFLPYQTGWHLTASYEYPYLFVDFVDFDVVMSSIVYRWRLCSLLRQYDETLIPEIVTTIELCGFSNILPPVQLDVRSDPATWPRPATNSEGAGGGGALWDAAMCINMIHIAPQVNTERG